MNYNRLGRTGLNVSTIGLGTAEIGFTYGIGDRPIPTDQEADRLLKQAVEHGINFFDTAHIHQLSDERIARSGIAKMPGIIIATKCGHFLEKGEQVNSEECRKRLRQEVEDNLRNLKLDVIQLLQLHGPSKEQIEEGLLIDIMQGFKDEGLIQYTGVSTRGEEAPMAAIKSGFFDVIHVAYSILDQRMGKHVLTSAREQDIGVLNRSVFLKGALTSLSSKLPPGLEGLQSHIQEVRMLAEELGMGLPELALRFALSNPAISVALIGTNKLKHLEASAADASRGPLPSHIVERLEQMALTDTKQIDPKEWPKLN